MKKPSIIKAIILFIAILTILRMIFSDRKIKFLTFLMELEGGGKLVEDTGGLTKYGIAQKFHPNVNVRDLTLAGAAAIYYTEYYSPLKLDRIEDTKLAYTIFDCCVNQGKSKAISLAWHAAGVSTAQSQLTDGLCKMLNSSPHSFNNYQQNRLAHYHYLATSNPAKYGKYLKGWESRLNKIAKKVI